jgi:hypothetical protein
MALPPRHGRAARHSESGRRRLLGFPGGGFELGRPPSIRHRTDARAWRPSGRLAVRECGGRRDRTGVTGRPPSAPRSTAERRRPEPAAAEPIRADFGVYKAKNRLIVIQASRRQAGAKQKTRKFCAASALKIASREAKGGRRQIAQRTGGSTSAARAPRAAALPPVSLQTRSGRQRLVAPARPCKNAVYARCLQEGFRQGALQRSLAATSSGGQQRVCQQPGPLVKDAAARVFA